MDTPKTKRKMRRKPTAHSSSKEQAVWKAMQQPTLAIAQILKLEAARFNEMK
jgi:hypothetical protein